MHARLALAGLAAVIAATLACSGNADPLSPTPNEAGASSKVSAPTPVSPVNDQQSSAVTLTASTAVVAAGTTGTLQYYFEVYDSANTRVVNEISTGPTYTVVAPLTFGQRYTWRVRAGVGDILSAWSAAASFLAPGGGYNLSGELYDPLINGETVGTPHGDVLFIPGVGAQLLNNDAYIDYPLPTTISDGEISAVVTNLCSCSGQPGIKTKVFSMSQGYDNLTDNDRRFTAEKRSGADKGVVAWRFITRQSQIDTEGAERVFVSFDPSKNYLWRGSFRNNYFNLTIDEIGGGRVYEFGKGYDGVYNPTPHVAFIGSPHSSSGSGSGSLAGMIIRHFWVSSRERTASMNQ